MNHEEHFKQHLDAILATLDEQHAQGAGQYRPTTTDEREALFERQYPHTVIDVYVIEREAIAPEATEEEPSTVDSTLAPTNQNDKDEEQEIETVLPVSPHRTPKRQHLSWWWMCALVVLCLLLIGTGTSLIVLVPLFTPSASVTIVTASRQLTTTSVIELVTNGNADPTKNQLLGRQLPAITMSQQKSIPTTGTTRQNARVAHGLITFYNGATYSQTIPAGTMLTGADGVQLVTDADAILPTAVFPTFGQASVYAHAVSAGPGGNVRAEDVYGACCRLNVSAVNGRFQGGQDARTYQSVTQQDITTVTTSIKTSLEQSVQAALQTQVQASETLVTPLACTSKVTSDHPVGEEATQLQVTLDETCTGIAYDTQALTNLAQQNALQDATTRLGTGYTTTGVQARITHIQSTNKLALTSVSSWMYPFTQMQQETMKTMIAGMSKDKATATLLHMTGGQSVSISLKNSSSLPTDTKHISILFLQV